MVSQSNKWILVMTPAEPLIRYFYYMCADSQKENITSASVSLYSLQDWCLVRFFRSMSRTTLKFIIIMLFYVHIYMAFIKIHKRPRNRHKEIFTVQQFQPNLSHVCNCCRTKISTTVFSTSCAVYCLIRLWGWTTDPVHNSLVTPDIASTRWFHIWWEECQIERCFCSYRHKWNSSH